MANKFWDDFDDFDELLHGMEGSFNALDFCVEEMGENVLSCLAVFEKFVEYHDDFFDDYKEFWAEYKGEIRGISNMAQYVNGMASKFSFVKDWVDVVMSDIEAMEVEDLVSQFEREFGMYKDMGRDIRRENKGR